MRVMIRTDLIEELLHVRLRVSFAKVGDFAAEVGRATAQVTELLLQVLDMLLPLLRLPLCVGQLVRGLLLHLGQLLSHILLQDSPSL